MGYRAKQIIIIRKDLKMRRGKEIAQGAHASQVATAHAAEMNTEAYREWIDGAFAKVCVTVDSEAALFDLAEKAKAAGLPVGLIEDSGRTEFHNVATFTALGIGPAYDHDLVPVTGELKLY